MVLHYVDHGVSGFVVGTAELDFFSTPPLAQLASSRQEKGVTLLAYPVITVPI